MNILRSHADQVLRIANEASWTTEAGDATEAIQRSWHRCVNVHKLDPASAHRVHVETAKGLSLIRDELGEFRTIARSCIEKLAKGNLESGYVILTNPQGVIADFVGSESWMQEAAKAGLRAGANWREDIAGTNGVGTCIVEQGPVTCHLDEHFHITQLGFSCSSVPLFSPDDDTLMGILNVSTLPSPGRNGDGNSARVLARWFAGLIDSANFVNRFQNYWILRLEHTSELLDVSHDLLLAIEADGVVVGATAGARRLLDAASAHTGERCDPIGQNLTSLFQCGYGDIWQMTNPQLTAESILLKTHANTRLFARAVAPRVGKTRVRTERPQSSDCPALSQMASNDKEMTRVLENARRLVNKQINILIQGETGTGKEVLARALHDSSSRAKKAFVAVNCAAIPESLIESELFGYTAGTFTGARSKGMQGLIERSSGGTLFLDEIGDMPLHLQTRLLRVLSEREVLPLGADRYVPIDLTVISASHRDLSSLVSAGTFREDLYYRLCGATLALPPLRDRQDKEYIIYRVLHQEAEQLGSRAWIDDAAMALLVRYPWPGNVRELRNALRFALAISDEGISVDNLPPELRGERAPPVVSNASASLDPYPEASSPSGMRDPAVALRDSLRRNKWNITAVSAELGLCRTSVYRQMKRFGIVPPTHL